MAESQSKRETEKLNLYHLKAWICIDWSVMAKNGKRVVVISEETFERVEQFDPDMTFDGIITRILDTIEQKGININF